MPIIKKVTLKTVNTSDISKSERNLKLKLGKISQEVHHKENDQWMVNNNSIKTEDSPDRTFQEISVTEEEQLFHQLHVKDHQYPKDQWDRSAPFLQWEDSILKWDQSRPQ